MTPAVPTNHAGWIASGRGPMLAQKWLLNRIPDILESPDKLRRKNGIPPNKPHIFSL